MVWLTWRHCRDSIHHLDTPIRNSLSLPRALFRVGPPTAGAPACSAAHAEASVAAAQACRAAVRAPQAVARGGGHPEPQRAIKFNVHECRVLSILAHNDYPQTAPCSRSYRPTV